MPKSRSRQRDRRRPYAAPPPKKRRRASPRWFGFVVLGLMGLGVLVIVLNYMAVLPPGRTVPGWLWGGLALIAGGFVAATQWR